MVIKAKDLKIGMSVVVYEYGERRTHKLTRAEYFPPIGIKHGAAFIALGTEEWYNGVPGLANTLDLEEDVEIEE